MKVATRSLLAFVLCTLLALPAIAAPAMLYVVQPVDMAGVTIEVVVPIEEPGLSDSGMATRAKRAFDALKARGGKAYGQSALTIESPTKATLVIDQTAEADRVLAEVFWTMASLGISELGAAPIVQGQVTLDHIAYGAHVPLLSVFDLLAFERIEQVPARAFVAVGGKPMPATEAARALAKGDSSVKGPVLAALSGKSRRAKLMVIEAVGRAGVRATYKLKADDLVPALEDTDGAVRSAALDAAIQAGVKGSKAVIAALEKLVEGDADTDLKLRAVKALSAAGVSRFDDLLEAEKIRTGSAAEAMAAVQKLSKSKQVAVAAPALVSALTHTDAGVRDAAFDGLVKLEQWELLHKALGSDVSDKMRERIAKVLVEKGNDAARDESLEWLIGKGGPDGAIFAAQTYGKRGSKAATPLLIKALDHESAQVRQAAAEALAALKDERAIVPLADAAQKRRRDEEFMMAAAVEIMKTLRLDQVKRLVTSKNTIVRQMAIRSLSEFTKGARPRPDVVALLMDALKDPEASIKRSAAYALARIEDDGIARDLAALKDDPDVQIRVQVCYALGHASAKYTEAGPMLVEMMKDREKLVRVAAIDGIALRKETSAYAQLVRLVNYPDPEIKRAVYGALLALRTPENADELRPKFRKGMEFRDSNVRMVCLDALAEGTVKEDFEALRQAAFDPSPDVKKKAITVIAGSKLPEGMEVLTLFFGDADNGVREAALDALGAIDASGNWAAKKKRYLNDFIGTPNMPDALVAKAKSLLKKG
ncbi:MAG: hypothetical protein RIT45_3673 [Pseudomonadota bacterium]|jgi:HEAT repeat protein